MHFQARVIVLLACAWALQSSQHERIIRRACCSQAKSFLVALIQPECFSLKVQYPVLIRSLHTATTARCWLELVHGVQVASHAQKYFIRLNSMNKKDKRRSSIHDITSVNPPTGDMSGGLLALVTITAHCFEPAHTQWLCYAMLCPQLCC